jgi:hypothetical protein
MIQYAIDSAIGDFAERLAVNYEYRAPGGGRGESFEDRFAPPQHRLPATELLVGVGNHTFADLRQFPLQCQHKIELGRNDRRRSVARPSLVHVLGGAER